MNERESEWAGVHYLRVETAPEAPCRITASGNVTSLSLALEGLEAKVSLSLFSLSFFSCLFSSSPFIPLLFSPHSFLFLRSLITRAV